MVLIKKALVWSGGGQPCSIGVREGPAVLAWGVVAPEVEFVVAGGGEPVQRVVLLLMHLVPLIQAEDLVAVVVAPVLCSAQARFSYTL